MILSCSHISKAFGENTLFSDVSFHINDNEKCAIVGINGAGKTKLLRIITGESGRRQRRSCIFKGYKLWLLKTAGKNLF